MESDTSRLSLTVSRGAATAWAAPPPAGGGPHAMTAAAVIQAPIRPPRTKCFVLTSRPPLWSGGSRRRMALRVRLEHGHVVLPQDLGDLAVPAVDHRIERGLERLVAMPHGHPHVPRASHSRNGVGVRQRAHRERDGLTLYPIPPQGR